MMYKYKIEYRILTLAKNAVAESSEKLATFSVDDVEFSHWSFSHMEGWIGNYWISKFEAEADNRLDAYKACIQKLKRIVPRLSLITQSYIEFIGQPFLITKEANEIGFFGYVEETEGVGLMFMENEKEALTILLENESVPEEFYYYWNDAVNTTGYSAKLLLMFSAIEALTKKSDGTKDFEKINEILGEDLNSQLFQQNTGLRHRLIHGEYFSGEDPQVDYLEVVHKKIINYFNASILNRELLNTNVKNPQRHFFGNREVGRFFIRKIDKGVLDFREVLNDFSENEFHTPKTHEHVFEEGLNENF